LSIGQLNKDTRMKKLKLILQSIRLYFFRSSNQPGRNAPFNICDKIQTVRHVLVCIANHPVEAMAGVAAVKELKSTCPEWRISVCADDTVNMSGLHGVTIFRRSEADLNFYDMPKQPFLQNIFHHKFDLVIDLALEYDFTNLAILWKSEAELRIGFYHPRREDFYNFLLRQKPDATPEQAGRLLVNTLTSL